VVREVSGKELIRYFLHKQGTFFNRQVIESCFVNVYKQESLCFHIELNLMVHNVALQLLRVFLNKVLVNRKIKSLIMVSVFICLILTTEL